MKGKAPSCLQVFARSCSQKRWMSTENAKQRFVVLEAHFGVHKVQFEFRSWGKKLRLLHTVGSWKLELLFLVMPVDPVLHCVIERFVQKPESPQLHSV